MIKTNEGIQKKQVYSYTWIKLKYLGFYQDWSTRSCIPCNVQLQSWEIFAQSGIGEYRGYASQVDATVLHHLDPPQSPKIADYMERKMTSQ